ncbi:hypothetical protein BH10ACI2_BH10ACI2_18990 [soil metagenome]
MDNERSREANDTLVPSESIRDAVRQFIWHPVEMLVLRWNWKSALLSALLRAPIFFTAYLAQKQGLSIALGAMLLQSVFRTGFGGICGSILQGFSKVRPAWHAVVTIPIVLAAVSHIAEFVIQSLYDMYTLSQGKSKAILVSVAISVVSAIFNLFAMQRGVLLVKDESQQSIWKDLRQMPWLALEFISFPLVWTIRRTKRI